MKHYLKISTDFSQTPGARYYEDGDFSGQEFYDKKLRFAFEKALHENAILRIDLDGTEGYATSFLDEAFLRLAQEFGKTKAWNNIEIISKEEPDWIDEVKSYIFDAPDAS